MIYFDSKAAVFVNKSANCRKSAKPRRSTRRVERLDFWKILAGRVHLMEASASSQMQCVYVDGKSLMSCASPEVRLQRKAGKTLSLWREV